MWGNIYFRTLGKEKKTTEFLNEPNINEFL